MKKHAQFIISLAGLKDGLHEFNFEIDNDFFSSFEASPVQEGQAKVNIYFDKRPDLNTLIFDITGKVKVECDRCLEPFFLPIKSNPSLIIKYGNAPENNDPDILYLTPGTPSIDVGDVIYEYIILAIPLIKKHEDAGEECLEDIIAYLNPTSDTKGDTEETDGGNSPWDALKDLKLN